MNDDNDKRSRDVTAPRRRENDQDCLASLTAEWKRVLRQQFGNLAILDFLDAVAMPRKEMEKKREQNMKTKADATQKKIMTMSLKMMKHMRVLVNSSTKTNMSKSIEVNTTVNTKTNLKMMVNMNLNMKLNAMTKVNMNMKQKTNMRMNLKSKVNMNEHSRCSCAMVAKRLSGMWLCAGPHVVMTTAEAHLLTISGDREG
jgi:hypothetical protein